MDTIKSFNGYGKVDPQEELAFKRKTRKRLIILGISLIVLVVLIIGAVVGTIVHNKNKNDSNAVPSTQTYSAAAIKGVCSVTQYQESCFTSLSSMDSSNSTDPEKIFHISLKVVMDSLEKLSTFPEEWMNRTNDPRVKEALKVCKIVLDEAVDYLNDSISTMNVNNGEKLISVPKIEDLKTWLSTIITDQETCLDALNDANASLVEDVKLLMANSTEYASNSLAIVSKLLGMLGDFGFPIHRKLLGAVDSGLPAWVPAGDRRLLQEAMPQPNLTVAKDGGDVKTIKEAVARIPKKSKTRFVIYVKAGEYVENVILDKSLWNVMIYGDGKTATIISGSLNFVDGTPTFSTATFANVAKPRPDFIFGNSAVVLQNCNIMPRQPLPNQFVTITAQGKKDPNQNSGISIQRCTMSPLDNLTAPTYLGRPWKDFSTTVIMETEIGGFLRPQGWISWVSNVDPPSSIFYAEYRNTGLGSSVADRVKWAGFKPTLTPAEASKYSVQSLIDGASWLPDANVVFEST
ncbi:pectinesterase 1-like isoform X2 [Olea europaea var. sylvestris]|uniref:pectinesterase 1-like isoform X2 n=1 Tax=Olea europaea var. sylvestris TaxID=158386 RepID=UPI000C1CE5DB|nr:pectinesterase 1-like isoform X2 [Olea europaea var. sylvestris]